MADPAAGWRALVLRGRDVDAASDWLHVRADVRGVLDRDDGRVVWLVGVVPPLPPSLQVTVVEQAVSAAEFAITGLEHDRPVHLAEDLLVRPPWVERPAGFEGVELVVPRGGAFGSGEHASTRAALLLLHRVWPNPESFADIGTGSGILALYAHVRGCPHIEACDIDRPSVAAARELLPRARVELGGPSTLDVCDLVVANMTGTELGEELPAILRGWSRRQPLVLSGMRAHEVTPLVARVDADVRQRVVVEDFTAVAFAPAHDVR